MIRISQKQLSQMSHIDSCRFIAQMRKETSDLVISPHQQFSGSAPETAAQTSSCDKANGEEHDNISQLIIDAHRLGLMGKSAIRLYVHYMLRVAPNAADMAQYGIVMQALADTAVAEEEKAELLDAELMLATITNSA